MVSAMCYTFFMSLVQLEALQITELSLPPPIFMHRRTFLLGFNDDLGELKTLCLYLLKITGVLWAICR